MDKSIKTNKAIGKLSNAQKKIWSLIEPLLSNKSFLQDVEFIRKTQKHVQPILTAHLRLAYDIPTSAGKFIEHYIETGEHDKSLIEIPIKVLSTHDRTVEPSDDPVMAWKRHQIADAGYVGLIFNYDVTKDEIFEFIDKNYSKFIKPRLLKLSGPRKPRRARPLAARDLRIYTAYLEGKKPKDIGVAERMSAEDVRVIIKRQKTYHSRPPFVM